MNGSLRFQFLAGPPSSVIANLAAIAKSITKKHLLPRLAPAIFAFDALLIQMGRRFRPCDDTCNVVFVRTDNLGDFILWIPAAKALRAQWPWPNRRFILVANNSWAHFAEGLEIFDEVISLSRRQFQRNPIYRAKSLLFHLSRVRADLVVMAVYSRDPLTSDSVARAICAPRKVAPNGNSSSTHLHFSLSNKWYTELISTPEVISHETLRNAAFLKRLVDITVPNALPRLCVPNDAKLPSILRGLRYAVLAPGAVAPLRIWPAASFAELADRLFNDLGVRSVLTGTASESRFTRAILRASRSSPIDLAGRTNLSNLCAVLAHAKVIITNETGTAHLGAALGIHTICITGGGHFGRFVPYSAEGRQEDMRLSTVQHRMSCYGCDWHCIYPLGHSEVAPCVSNVSVEDVWSTLAVVTAGSGNSVATNNPYQQPL